MIPARYAPVVFGFFLSGMMSCVVSGIATLRALGLGDGVFQTWMLTWAYSWAVAFPLVLVAAPVARRIVNGLVRPE